jgi:hypothetical protein
MVVDEDRVAHGRHIEIENILLNVGGQYEVTSKRLKLYFYPNNIEVSCSRIG